MRDILARQKDLHKDTDKIKDKLDPDKFDPKQAEAQKDAANISEAQNNLAQKTQELMDTIAKAQVKRAEQGDKDTANKLQEAGKIANDAKLPEKMRGGQGPERTKAEHGRPGSTGKHQETGKDAGRSGRGEKG